MHARVKNHPAPSLWEVVSRNAVLMFDHRGTVTMLQAWGGKYCPSNLVLLRLVVSCGEHLQVESTLVVLYT